MPTSLFTLVIVIFSFLKKDLDEYQPSNTLNMASVGVALSIRRKQLVAEQLRKKEEEGTKLTQTAEALWTKETPKLMQMADRSVISCIVKDAKMFVHSHIHSNSRRARPPAVPRLVAALYRWMCSMSNNGVLINTAVVQIKA